MLNGQTRHLNAPSFRSLFRFLREHEVGEDFFRGVRADADLALGWTRASGHLSRRFPLFLQGWGGLQGNGQGKKQQINLLPFIDLITKIAQRASRIPAGATPVIRPICDLDLLSTIAASVGTPPISGRGR